MTLSDISSLYKFTVLDSERFTFSYPWDAEMLSQFPEKLQQELQLEDADAQYSIGCHKYFGHFCIRNESVIYVAHNGDWLVK